MSRRIRIKGLGLLLLGICPSLWAQQAMSLEDAQRYAFKNSYLISNSRHEIEKAEKRLWEITAIGLPQASASLNYQYSPDLPEQPVPAEFFGGEPGTFQTVAFGVSNSSVATFQINQLVFDGTYLLARQGSILLKKIRNDELTKSTIDARDEVARAYYNVQLSAEAEKILQSNLANLSKNLQEVRALYEEGFLEEQDAQQLEYLVNGISLELENARRMGKVAMDFFRFTIGMPMDSAVQLSQGLEELYLQNASGQLVSEQAFRLEEHIEYQLVENQETGAALQVKRRMWDFAPKVNGFLTHQQSNFDNDAFNMFNYNSYWIPSTVMGLSVSMPLFTSFANKMRLDQARIDLIEVQEAKDQIVQALTLEYEQAKSAYSYASDRLSNEQRNREITKSIRDKTLIKYKEGISSSLEVTQTQNQYLNSETNYLSAMLELLNAKSRLDKVLGNYNKQ